MKRPPYYVRIVSKKGGVGKTTVATNLSVALARKGYKVLLLDLDTINPCLIYYFNLGDLKYGLTDLYAGKAKINDVITRYDGLPLYVLPCLPAYESRLPKIVELKRLYKEHLEQMRDRRFRWDFVVSDTPPGFSPLFTYKFYSMYIVMTPNIPAAMSAVRLSRVFTANKVKNYIVINKVRRNKGELSAKEVEAACGAPIAIVPYSNELDDALNKHVPACISHPKSDFSRSIEKLANVVIKNREKGRGTERKVSIALKDLFETKLVSKPESERK